MQEIVRDVPKKYRNIKNVIVEAKFVKEIMKLKEFSEMRCSFFKI